MSDTDLNDELMKNVTEQTAFLMEEEMQGPMTLGETLAENFNVMTREQLSRQYELLDKRHRELVTEYQKRKNQASLKEAKPAVKRVIEKRGVDYSVPREPDLAGKKKKNRRKELAKKKKKALAFNPEATEYTTDILALEKERSSRGEYMAEFDKRFLDFVKPLESTAEAERIRNLEQCWSGITVFAPKLVLGKKGVPTEETRKKVEDFYNDMVNAGSFDGIIKEIKKQLLEEKVNPHKFSATYIGEHFEEMRDQVDRMKAYTEIFREGTPQYELLSIEEKAYVKTLAETYVLAKNALFEGARMNGVRLTDTGEAGSDGKPDINAYSEAGKALAEHLETRDQRVKEEADKIAGVEFEKRWDKTSRFKCQLAQTILKDEGKLEKYAFIKTPLAFSNLYDSVYELTRKMGKLIEKHPEKYDENKKLISSLMDEAVKCVQVESDYGLKCAVWESILYGTEIIEDGGDLKEINVKANDDKTIGRKYAADSDKMNLCNDMLNSISEAICYVLGGEVPLEAGCRILKEKGYEVPEFKGKVDEAKKSARRYLDLPEEKKEVFDDLFKAMKLNGDSPLLRSEPLRSIHLAIRVGQPMYNEQIMLFVKDCLRLEQLNGKLKENKATDEEKKEAEGLPERIKTEKTDILALMIETVKGLDMPWITEGDPNTLIAHQEELLEASYAEQLVKELGKEKDGDITLLDSLLGKSELKDPENGTYPDEVIRKTMSRIYFDSKMEQIRGGVMKARGAAMLHLYALDTLDETYVIPESQRKFAGPVSDSTAFSLAKDLYTQGAAKVKTETKGLFKNPLFLRDAQIGTGAAKIIESRVENDQTKKLIDIYTATSEESKKRKTDNQTLIREQYDVLGKKIEEIDRQLADKTIGEEKRKELEIERKKTVTDMEDLQIVYGLSCKRFGSATRKMSIKELFRSLPIMDACGSFKGMTDEQRREVLLDLTAGAFLTKEADEKELKLADMRNMAGVRMYLTYAANRYERLIDKYGKGKPDMLYVMEHKDEILCDVSMAQEDSELLKGYKDAFDLNQTKDLRTYYLIEYGTALCWSLSLLINFIRPQVMSPSGGTTYEEALEEAWSAEKEKRKIYEELKEKQGVLRNGYIFERGELQPQATQIFRDAAARALEKAGTVH